MNHEHAIRLIKNGYVKQAIDILSQAVKLNPEDQAAFVNLCLAQESLRQFKKAEVGYRWILSRWPNNVEAKSNLANLLAQTGRAEEAAQLHHNVLESSPEDVYSLDALAKVQAYQGKIEECVANLRKVAEITGKPRAWSEYLSYGLHVGYDLEGHKQWAEKFAKPLAKPIPNLPYDGKRKIKIGYVSNTWDRHSVSAFILPILRGHSDNVHVTLYSDIETPAELKEAVDEFISIRGLNHFAFGSRIRMDRIDVLIDLDGHKLHSRLLDLASNPAPVVGTMNGYLPDTHTSRNFNIGWTYEPHKDVPDPSPLPADRNGFVTFGSFNRAHKITQAVPQVWAAILAGVPHSRLVVASKDGEGNTALRERLEAGGIPSDRLTLVAPQKATGDYLRALGEIDIHLDCWPFAGVSITCDALYQGVPTVSRRTDEAQGQVGASLLSAVGLDDLVGADEASYVKAAQGLAGDLDRLRSLRADLRARMAPLLNGKPLAERLERRYREALLEPRPPAGKPCGPCQRKRNKNPLPESVSTGDQRVTS